MNNFFCIKLTTERKHSYVLCFLVTKFIDVVGGVGRVAVSDQHYIQVFRASDTLKVTLYQCYRKSEEYKKYGPVNSDTQPWTVMYREKWLVHNGDIAGS